MTTEQRQIIDELKKIEARHPGEIGTVAWRAWQEIEGLIAENNSLQTSRKPH